MLKNQLKQKMVSRINIWIVDDDPIFQMIFKMMIERVNTGIHIGQYKNGQEALDALLDISGNESLIPHYIFLDINMPVKNGWDFLDELPSIALPLSFSKTQVFIVSSSINPEDEEKARTYPMTKDFLVKPLSESLVESIARP